MALDLFRRLLGRLGPHGNSQEGTTAPSTMTTPDSTKTTVPESETQSAPNSNIENPNLVARPGEEIMTPQVKTNPENPQTQTPPEGQRIA